MPPTMANMVHDCGDCQPTRPPRLPCHHATLPPLHAAMPHRRGLADDGTVQPVLHRWNDFAFLDDGGLVFCQQGSGKLLFSQLPLLDGDGSGVFLFGSHAGALTCRCLG